MRATPALDALVLDLDARAGLSIARSLGAAGYRIGIAARDGSASGLRTRYAARRAVLPDPAVSFADHVAALVAELEAAPADATIPSIDSSLEALHRNRDRLGRLTAPAIASIEAVEIALSKERTIEIARTFGAPVPRSVMVTDSADLDAAIAEIGAPCVLKPVSSWRPLEGGGERVSPLYGADPEAARRIAAELVRPGAPVLVQELAGGARETIKLFRSGGVTLARFAMTVERCWPPLGGSSVMRRTLSPPADTLAIAEQLVAEVGLEGYSEVEFRRDGTGRPLLMEINPRLSQSYEVAARAGIDFARMQLEWARGGTVPHPPRSARVGLRVGWVAGDLRLLLGTVAGSPPPRPQLAATAGAIGEDYLLRRARWEGFDLRDPKPILGALAFTVRGLRRG